MKRLSLGVWAVLILLLVPTTQEGQPSATVRFTVKTPDTVVLHEPIGLVVTLQNALDEQVSFGVDSIFDIEIVLPSGKTVQVTAPRIGLEPQRPDRNPDGNIGFVTMLQIAPLSSATTTILLNKFYDFPIGTYQVNLRPKQKSSSGRKLQIIDTSKSPIIITVGMPNDEHLRRVCSALAENAIRGSGMVRLDSAEALSWVNDSVAVPFLRQTLEQADGLRSYGLEGLVRIGTPGAYDALIASNMLGNSQVGSYLSAVLKREELATSDQALKARIHAALQR